MTDDDTAAGGLVLFALWLGFYMLPGIVAYIRHHRQELAITVLNFFLGWTIVGWVLALVWACTSDVKPPRSLPWRKS